MLKTQNFLGHNLKMSSLSNIININYKVLRSIGLWTLKTDNILKKLFYYFYQCFSILLYSSGMLAMVIDLYVISNDIEKFNFNLCIGVTVSLHFVKTLNTLKNLPVINQLKNVMIKNMEEEANDDCKEIMSKTMSEMKFFNKICYIVVYMVTTAWVSIPFLDKKKGIRKFPFRQWFPFDSQISPYYEAVYVYQVMSAYMIVSDMAANDLLTIHFMIGISTEYDIMRKKLEKLDELYREKIGDEKGLDKRTDEIIRNVVIYHQKILWQIKQFEVVNNRTMMLHFVALTFLLAILGFDLTVSEEINTKFISQTGYLVVVLGFLYVFCHFGARLENKSFDVAFQIYSTPWFLMETKFQRDLGLIMAKAQQAPTATCLNLFNVNFRTFIKVLRHFYDMMALMRHIFKEKHEKRIRE